MIELFIRSLGQFIETETAEAAQEVQANLYKQSGEIAWIIYTKGD
jgi:hypothetical protein